MSCKYGRIGVFISSFLCTNIHIPKIVGILDLFRETHRIITQYWLVFLVFSIAFSRRRKECANMVELVFSLVHSLNKQSHYKNLGNLGCFFETHRIMTQYWVVFLPLPSVGVAKNVQLWSNWCCH